MISMNRFCPKCGSPVDSGKKFCPKCGAPLQGQEARPSNEGNETAGQQKWILCAAATIILLGGGFLGYQHFGGDKQSVSPPAATSSAAAQSKPDASSKQGEADAQPVDQYLQKAKDQMKRMGIDVAKVTAYSGYVEDYDKGFMALADGKLWIVDMKNHRAATIENPECLKKFHDYFKKAQANSIIVKFNILNDTPGEDQGMGEWNGNDHYLPMFISWKLDGKNTVDSGLFTGKGKNPGHYHAYLYEQKNVDLAHVFLAKANQLASDAERRGVI